MELILADGYIFILQKEKEWNSTLDKLLALKKSHY